MSATNWSEPADAMTVSKRAKARDWYNARRTASADWRRHEAGKLLREVGYPATSGWQADLARRLGVHRSTICRDFAPYKKIGPWCLAIANRTEAGQRLIAELLRIEMVAEIRRIEESQRMERRLDRRRRRQREADRAVDRAVGLV